MGKQVDVAKVKLPPGMSPLAKKEFRRIREELILMGVTEIDQPTLVAYLTHYAVWLEAKAQVEQLGAVVNTPKGQLQINPWHSVMKQNSELVKKWVQELGFSPGSRKRLGLAREEPEDDSELVGE